jgi:uracil-DNA glycosylase
MPFFDQLHPEWQVLLTSQRVLLDEIESKINFANITPEQNRILAAYRLPPSKIKVVVFGQDPYPTSGNAQGIAFSVPSTSPIPASLRNIFKEVSSDCGSALAKNGDLTRWVDQGVFLLNRILTTEAGTSLAHQGIGWEEFTQATAQLLGQQDVIGIFWGNKAFELARYFKKELIVKSAHPSPLSAYRGFFGSKPFTQVNRILEQQGKSPIIW